MTCEHSEICGENCNATCRENRAYNRRLGIRYLAEELVKQGSLLTMAEAMERAVVLFDQGHRASGL
jgi:hypothetical protein